MGINHKMLWFEDDFEVKKRVKKCRLGESKNR